MRFEWDPKKAVANLSKHGVDVADAVTIFEDDLALTVDDDHTDEQRHVTLGLDAQARILVVCWTWRGEAIRIISARGATPGERKQYGQSK